MLQLRCWQRPRTCLVSTRRGSPKEAQALHSKKPRMLPKYQPCCRAHCSRKTHKLPGVPVCFPGYGRKHPRAGYLWADALCPWEACPYHLAALSSTCDRRRLLPPPGPAFEGLSPPGRHQLGLRWDCFAGPGVLEPWTGKPSIRATHHHAVSLALLQKRNSFLDPFVGQKWEIKRQMACPSGGATRHAAPHLLLW